MGSKSGERARRVALGLIQGGVTGASVALARQTLRYSIDTPRVRQIMADKISKASGKKKDKSDLLGALALEIKRLERQRKETTESIKSLGECKGVLVTDHAVLRFLERVMGIDVDAIRAQMARIVPPQIVDHERAIYVRDGKQYIVRGGTMLTVMDEYMDPVVEEYFAIDDQGFGELVPVEKNNSRISRAARMLSQAGSQQSSAYRETHARLRAAREAGYVGGVKVR